MIKTDSEHFLTELKKRSEIINKFILDKRFNDRFRPDHINHAVTAYVQHGGKRLRPAILMFSCGAVGGDEKIAVPAAAAVEIFHTWTLVHDDIIDRDSLRRRKPTVHTQYSDQSVLSSSGITLTADEAKHYGVSIAILTGDVQHGWGISLMAELTSLYNVDPLVTLDLIYELDTKVLNTLVEGEVLDIQFSQNDIELLRPDMIEDMLWKKTGALYEFCGRAGAYIGTGNREDPMIEAIARFAALCGTAFQLQDDILGIIGKEETLGKPIGSDLREGKRTLVIYYAWNNAGSDDRKRIKNVLGNQTATEADIDDMIKLLRDLGGIESVADRARHLIEEARPKLDIIPDSPYRDLLYKWAEFLINREF